jgi:protein O-GlcNAc transferase
MTDGQLIAAGLDQIREYASRGRIDAAELVCEQLLQAHPSEAEAWSWRGLLRMARGRFGEAEAAFLRANQLTPNNSHYQSYLSGAVRELGRASEAEQYARRAIELDSKHASYWFALGAALADQQQWREAIVTYQKTLEIDPGNARAWQALGAAALELGDLDDAQKAFERSLEIDSGSDAAIGYAHLLGLRGETERAEKLLLTHLQRVPHSALAAAVLFDVLQRGGEFSKGESACHLTLEINRTYEERQLPPPLAPMVHSSLVFRLPFLRSFDNERIQQELGRWNRQHAQPLQPFIQPHCNPKSPERRLRVGYVSPHFSNHCQVFFMMPLLSAHDHSQFEVFCYSDVTEGDVFTDDLRAMADVWRETRGMSDECLANLIRQDGVDILVDLTMHMERNRLLMFARKPAPVQVCWLAYPGSTGVAAMDYRLTDPYLDPADDVVGRYSETSVRLPDSFWCYDPLTGDEPAVSSLPALLRGDVSFGNFNGISKINEAVIRLWSSVLSAVDGSRMTLLAPTGRVRQAILNLFVENGVRPDRISFVETQPRLPYLKEYQRIDLVLDTFPYNGHTTTLDAFWMGVPVVSLVGETVVGRAGLSMHRHVGLADLVAHSAEQFVGIAVELSGNLARLNEMRQNLRPTMQHSPLMDFSRFARGIEAAYRGMWKEWCYRPEGA